MLVNVRDVLKTFIYNRIIAIELLFPTLVSATTSKSDGSVI